MRVLRTLFSLLLALIAIPLLTTAACNFAIEAAFFNRTTYDAVLEDDTIFDELSNGLFPLLLSVPLEDIEIEGDNTQPVRVQEIAIALQDKPDVLADVTTTLLPTDTVQETVTLIVDTFFEIATGDSDAIEREIDLSIVRERLSGVTASNVATRIIEEAPICTREQQNALRTFLEADNGTLPICNPQGDEATTASIESLETWLRSIGDEFITTDRTTIGDLLDITIDQARSVGIVTDLLFNQILVLFFLCPFGILSLVVIVSVRRLNDFGRWIGGVAVAVGVLLVILIIGLQIFAFGTLSELLESTNTTSEVFLARFISAFLRSAINASSTSLLSQSAAFIGFGFLLLGLSWYLGRERDDMSGDVVIITDDGQIISTATQRRIGMIEDNEEAS